MKLWLDDVRPAPEGWLHLKTPVDVIEHLCTGDVEELSLDHDLGLVTSEGREWTGYDVLTWIEEQLATSPEPLHVPRISIHSANSVGRDRMQRALESIGRLQREPSLGTAARGQPRLASQDQRNSSSATSGARRALPGTHSWAR